MVGAAGRFGTSTDSTAAIEDFKFSETSSCHSQACLKGVLNFLEGVALQSKEKPAPSRWATDPLTYRCAIPKYDLNDVRLPRRIANSDCHA